jgi:hypothetical protein
MWVSDTNFKRNSTKRTCEPATVFEKVWKRLLLAKNSPEEKWQHARQTHAWRENAKPPKSWPLYRGCRGELLLSRCWSGEWHRDSSGDEGTKPSLSHQLAPSMPRRPMRQEHLSELCQAHVTHGTSMSQTEGPFALMPIFHKLKSVHGGRQSQGRKANDSAWVVCHAKKQMWSFLGQKRWDERKQCEHRVLNPKVKVLKGGGGVEAWCSEPNHAPQGPTHSAWTNRWNIISPALFSRGKFS